MGGVKILNDQTENIGSSGGNAAQSEIRVAAPASGGMLLTISAYGSSVYQRPGGPKNAGIRLSISVDGDIVAQDDSFEGESSSITFTCSASYVGYVEPGKDAKILAKVDPYGTGGTHNKNTKVVLRVIAVAADK